MTQVIAAALQLGGMPVPVGGGVRLVDALAGIVDATRAARCAPAPTCERILVAGGKATGVRLAGGEVVAAERAVVASVTPTQLYGRLLGDGDVPDARGRRRRRFRYGRAEMQIHLALDAPPRLEGSGRAGARALPDRPRHARPRRRLDARSTRRSAGCCRPRRRSSAASPARSIRRARPTASRSSGSSSRSCLPGRSRAMPPASSTSGDGTWTEELREAYADRIVARLGGRSRTSAPRRRSASCSRRPDLEPLNCNLVGGDIYGGSCALDQNLLWRPLAEAPGHATRGRRASGTSARARIPARGSAPAPAISSAKELTKPPLARDACFSQSCPGRS